MNITTVNPSSFSSYLAHCNARCPSPIHYIYKMTYISKGPHKPKVIYATLQHLCDGLCRPLQNLILYDNHAQRLFSWSRQLRLTKYGFGCDYLGFCDGFYSKSDHINDMVSIFKSSPMFYIYILQWCFEKRRHSNSHSGRCMHKKLYSLKNKSS